jgi:hypothetical protein
LFRSGKESAHTLIQQRPEEMAVDAVAAILDADPQLVEEWQRWSDDKRRLLVGSWRMKEALM